MLNEAIAINPPEKAEGRPLSNSSRKSTTLSAVNKTYKSKIPTTHSGRNAMQVNSMNQQSYEESSNGMSSNNSSARRPAIKNLNMPLSNKKLLSAPAAEKRQLEMQYGTKKMRYANLRKALVDKQKIAQELYNEMLNLREKIIATGGKDPGKLEELRLFQVDCNKQILPTSIETDLPHNCYEQQEQINMESTVMGISLLQNQLQDINNHSQELHQYALDIGSSFTSLVKSWMTEALQNQIGNVSISVNSLEAQLQTLERNNEDLKTRLQQLTTTQKDFVAEFAKRSSSLRSEYDNYRERMKERPNADQKDLREQLGVTLEELKMHRDKANQVKERTRVMELQMQKAKAKIRELEGNVANEEAKSQQLQNSVKSLEVQLKQKDQTMEQKMKDMYKAIKSSESLLAKVEKQRDTFESRMMELKEKMTYKENEANATIKELSEKFKVIDEEIKEEREKRQQAERVLCETQERCKHLKEKSQMICDLTNEKSNNLTVADNNHTENEVCLRNNLKEARNELEKQKEQIEQLKNEKLEILAVMHQAASNDNEDETKRKLAAELIVKINDFQNLTLEHIRLQKVARFAQEKNAVLENQLTEIHHQFRASLKESGKAGLSADVIELHQEISDLRNNLDEVVQQNKQLETTLTQMQLELEQRDHAMREQSKFLKVRDELLSLLKVKQMNTDNLGNEDIDELNKIAIKTEAIQELYATLEAKQVQVMRLEKLVKLLEDQHDRAQAQRTRLEQRIAQLEVKLREKSKNNRYVVRKYLLEPRSNIVEANLSCTFSCESGRALVTSSAPSRLRLFNPRSRRCSGTSCYRYRRVSSIKNPLLRSINTSNRDKFASSYVNDWYWPPSDKKDIFICQRCRRDAKGIYGDDVIHSTIQDHHDFMVPFYDCLTESSTLEAFDEPTNSLNELNDGFSSISSSLLPDEDADCFFRLVNSYVLCGDGQDRNRGSRNHRERQYRWYRRCSSKQFLRDTSSRW